jgi:tRNA wybutosine-synthesizing protein 4
MANVLCQVRGTKRLVLYPPSDVRALGIPPGGSSSAINVFEPSERQRSRLAQTHAREAVLRPGDVLFIPPLWCHAASPADGASIAVNVFFRDLGDGYAAGKDVYANRDVQAYADGRRAIARLVAKFDGLPPAMARFYLERLGDELRERAPAGGPGHGWCDS